MDPVGTTQFASRHWLISPEMIVRIEAAEKNMIVVT